MKRINWRTFADFSIRYKLFASYLMVIILPLILLLLLHLYLSTNETEKQAKYSAQKMLEETKSHLQYRAEMVKEVLNSIAFSDTVQNLVSEDPKRYEDVNLWGLDANRLSRVVGQFSYNSDIESVQVYMEQGLASVTESTDFLSMKNLKHSLWFRNFLDSHSVLTWLPSSVMEEKKDNNAISVLRVIPSPHNITKMDGIVRAQISQSTMISILEHAMATPSTSVALFNEQGEILSTSKTFEYTTTDFEEILSKALTGRRMNIWEDNLEFNGQRILLGLQEIPETDLRVAMIVPYTDILKSSNAMRDRLIFIFLLIIPLTLVLSFVVAGSATKRLRKLTRHVRKVKNGDFGMNPLPVNQDEIGELISNFNVMVDNVSRLLEETYTLGREVKNKELKALQAQINPHFLYNTLELINAMAINSGNGEISKVVDRLALFYRLSLSNGRESVTLESELTHVESYVSIQNMRFNNAITLTMNVPPELLHCEVPKIMLQPLIENAILHGILETDSEKGEILVSARTDEGNLLVEVIDNGIGIDEKVLENILNSSVSKGTGGFGIWNIQERIKLNYGSQYGLLYKSQLGEGTSVQIFIPKK
ncbi:histidine kinase [Paenibacillus sp. Root52]|uniref:histidine kinase n=1 Tax=Paenibacillus amylolyticus TaxID=1451 RepID=A0AAP5GZZ9_PAEAM|nr:MULTISPECIES: sensor histidine kinase [Paenibacillus]KQY94383.1 histidine kinase [Paenibacillus sp. Root52]MDR6721634.1 two-component system sensor histidine kinase YesM [Paenibacillus amylolyticus]